MKKIEAYFVLGIVFLISFPVLLIILILSFFAELIICFKTMFFGTDTEYYLSVLTEIINEYIKTFKKQYKLFVE